MKWMPVVLLLAVIAGGGATQQYRAGQVRAGLVKDLEAAKTREVTRTPPMLNAVHDNGFQCLGLMLDVAPRDIGEFARKDELAPMLTGAHPELLEAARPRLQTLSPWAKSMRECASSKGLRFVEGVSPWATPPNVRASRLALTTAALFRFTAIELQVLLADGQQSVVLERCSETLALGADLTHLGLQGAALMRMGLRVLAPACGAALATSSADVKAQVAKQWATIPARLARPAQLMEAERLSTELQGFAWTMGVPEATLPTEPTVLRRWLMQRLWLSWDAAARKLEAVAATPGPERTAAAKALAQTLDAWWVPTEYVGAGVDLERTLVMQEENDAVLTLLLALALNDETPRPQVTWAKDRVTFTPAGADPILIPR